MKRRDFLKTVSATGMAVCTPAIVTNKAYADLTPVGRYFVFLHLGGGWDPTSFCDPKGNITRGSIDPNTRNSGSRVNKFCKAAIRRVADIALNNSVDSELTYAPYYRTFNESDQDSPSGDATNTGVTMEHVQRMMAGSIAPDPESANRILLNADESSDFSWAAVRSNNPALVEENAKAILEGRVDRIEFGGLVDQMVDDTLELLDGSQMDADRFVYDAFCCLYGDKVRVLNGVDNRTNGHDTGTRFADTGSMDMSYPDFSALYAAVKGADRPLAYITDGGGNDETAGLVPRSSASDVNVFNTLADPEGSYLDDGMKDLVERAKQRRRQLLNVKESLPRRNRLQSQLYMVRDEGLAFSGVASRLANPTDPDEIALNDAANNGRQRQMRIGAAAMSTGMASSMQIGFGGFDTHNDHDDRHFFRIRDVLVDLHYLWRALAVYGIDGQTTVALGSDFGRTPWYNSGEGKDHWAVTSYVLMGQDVSGGTVVNATNPLVGARNVQVSGNTLTPVDGEQSGSIRMTPAHLHRGLRSIAGIQNETFSLDFPIEAEDIPVFG